VIGRQSATSLALLAQALVALSLAGATARADEAAAAPRPLGRLEQESVDEAMTALGLRVDPHPAGKVIGAIHVVNQEVFSRRDWYLQLGNIFHRTTRPDVLARELLMKPGDRYDPELVEETTRNLQVTKETVGSTTFVPPELSSVVAIIPVVAASPGDVDLLVVTRDVWSLRLNTNFELQQKTLTLLQTSLSENNLFGWRKYLSVVLTMDQGSMAIGPSYFDPNIHGTRLTLLAAARPTPRPRHGRPRGTPRPSPALPALRPRQQRGRIDLGHVNVVQRSFQGTHLRLEDLRATPDVVELLPYIYRREVTTVDSNVVRSFGRAVIQRVTLGHLYDRRRSSLVPGFPATPEDGQLFLAQYAPLSQRRSEPYLRYDMFTARYAVYRDLDTFDLRENRRLGPSLSLRVGYDLPALGSDFSAPVVAGSASWAEGFAGSYEQLSLQASGRRRGEVWIDQHLKGFAYLATPVFARAFRITGQARRAPTR
jgi:hypothetical protein